MQKTISYGSSMHLLPLALWGAVFLVSLQSTSAGEISFNRDIRPILSDRCFACHGPDANDRQASLRLDLAEGDESAFGDTAAIVPGSVDQSALWHRITTDNPDEAMPPADSHKKPLTETEQQLIRQWIEEGAAYDDFWAFVPPTRGPLPSVEGVKWSEHPIDLRVLAKLESLGLSPADEADRRTLIRRLTLDLTGLPPTVEEIREFLEDERPDAYEHLVDDLLSRQQYGEHMARYWLDLVRFADTNGMHKDFYRNFVAYRDWVINAFNENLGYDDFVRYQLAGDLYTDPTKDQLIASGFNRLHLIIDVGTALPEESHFKNVVDRVTATGTVFMGMTVHCATCHDHKYDPLTQKDFYSLFAFFNNLDAEPETQRAPPNGLQPPFISLGTPQQQQQLAEYDEQLEQLDRDIATAKKSTELEQEPATEEKGQAKELQAAAIKDLERERKRLETQRDQFKATIPYAMVMRERAEVRETFVYKRGQYDAPGEAVQRATPGFLPPLKQRGEVASRMDLAEWLVDRNNPLTARVAVNRFWQQLFGIGLVKTSEDLGAQGEVPSHPELLDDLAVMFIESGWDVKALLRSIVLSRTYRQTSRTTPDQIQSDPNNRLLARGSRYRLDAEVIRDQILATSGLLSSTMFGPSVKPPQPDGLWKAVTMTGERYRADEGDAVYRRSLYTFWKRAMPPPQMTILNAPNRDACIARRERTNTPSQALLLLNEAEYLKAARHLANKILETIDAQNRINFAYEVVTASVPDELERNVLAKLIDQLHRYYLESPSLADKLCDGLSIENATDKATLAAWTVAVNTLYNLDITKNRE